MQMTQRSLADRLGIEERDAAASRSDRSPPRDAAPSVSGIQTHGDEPSDDLRAPTFMLTFDCEGKWGLVDCLAPRHERIFTSANLERTYKRLTALLHRYDIDATFAFTSAFCMTSEGFAALRDQMGYASAGAQLWIGLATAAIQRDAGQGWFVPACLEMALERGSHEIACHGFSHLPWRSFHPTRSDLDVELALCRSHPRLGADIVKTFVFPRNEVAHPDLLARRGFERYRCACAARSRAASLASELNLAPRSERLVAADEKPLAIPAGYFLNWRQGLRRCIPAGLTVRRWKNLVSGAAREGGIVHAWTHPENFLDGESMFPMLEEILRFVAEERQADRLRVATPAQIMARAGAARAGLVFPAPERDVAARGLSGGALAKSDSSGAPDPSRSSTPLVSIGMPVLNGGAALHTAVASVLSQTMTDWELLLMDDGSTDGEIEAIGALGHPRIRIVSDGRNKGVAARLNEALDLARGRYFARMDHDDISHPDRLRLQLRALQADPTLDLLACRCIKVGEGDRFTGYMPFAASHEEICRRPWLRIPMTHPSWLGRVEWFRRHRYPEPAPYYAEDFELLLRACETSRFAALSQVLLAYRVRSRIEIDKSLRARRAQYSLQRAYFSRKGQPGGALMAGATFLLRLGIDGCRAGTQAVGITLDTGDDVDPRDAAQWRRLIADFGRYAVERGRESASVPRRQGPELPPVQLARDSAEMERTNGAP